jgi:antitoxin component of MazEF toxin-antitoxin module
MGRAFLSKVQRSKQASESLRATIPEAVATALGVQEGDELSWMVEPGSVRVVVTRQAGSRAAASSSG